VTGDGNFGTLVFCHWKIYTVVEINYTFTTSHFPFLASMAFFPLPHSPFCYLSSETSVKPIDKMAFLIESNFQNAILKMGKINGIRV
jgi:hypothetical protein